MRNAWTPVVVAGLVVLGAIAAGCGDDGDAADSGAAEGDGGGGGGSGLSDERREEYVDAFLASGAEGPVDPADGRCVTGAMVDAIGAERLEAIGTPEEVRADQDLVMDALADIAPDVFDEDAIGAMYACPGMREMTIRTMAGEDATPEQRECVDEALTDEFLSWFWTLAMSGVATDGPPPPEYRERIEEQFGDCGILQEG